jgi:hypothetical protein
MHDIPKIPFRAAVTRRPFCFHNQSRAGGGGGFCVPSPATLVITQRPSSWCASTRPSHTRRYAAPRLICSAPAYSRMVWPTCGGVHVIVVSTSRDIVLNSRSVTERAERAESFLFQRGVLQGDDAAGVKNHFACVLIFHPLQIRVLIHGAKRKTQIGRYFPS